MKKILITGVSGFVGEEIYKYFDNKKYLIYGIDKVYPSFKINNKNFYIIIKMLNVFYYEEKMFIFRL